MQWREHHRESADETDGARFDVGAQLSLGPTNRRHRDDRAPARDDDNSHEDPGAGVRLPGVQLR